MRILDRYILTRFLLSFISSFSILLFIFIFQAIWLFVEEWAGKDIDISLMAKFLWNLIPTLMDKVILFTVLLASLLTFGNFAENYEFAAMKASGVSLLRSMRVLTIFSVLLGIGTFLLVNYVTPHSERQIFNMRTNLKDIKPASVIVEGVFSDIQGTTMNMMVEEKFGPDDSKLRNIVIHQRDRLGFNVTVIRAKEGELISASDNPNLVQLVLYDGYYYEEVRPKKAREQRKHPFARAHFETYVKNIDLSSLQTRELDDDRGIVTYKMKSVERLLHDIDSLEQSNLEQIEAFARSSSLRLGAYPLRDINKEDTPEDSVFLNTSSTIQRRSSMTPAPVKAGESPTIPNKAIGETEKDTSPSLKRAPSTADSTMIAAIGIGQIMDSIPFWKQEQVYRNAENNLQSLFNTVQAKQSNLKVQRERYNRHLLSLHKKFALAFACVILFFIGAPLGAIIKKGGIGFPMVIAFLLFIVYYFLGVFAENYAKKGNLEPILGAWLSTLIMLPLSVVLTRRANRDKQFAGINTSFGEIFKALRFRKVGDEETAEETEGFPGPETLLSLHLPKEVEERLDAMGNEELKDYALAEYEEKLSWSSALGALRILHNREVDLSDLKRKYLMGRSERQRYTQLKKRFTWQMRTLLASYILAALGYVMKLMVGAGPQSAIYLFLLIFSIGVYLLTYFALLRTLTELRYAKIEGERLLSPIALIVAFVAFPAAYIRVSHKVKAFINF